MSFSKLKFLIIIFFAFLAACAPKKKEAVDATSPEDTVTFTVGGTLDGLQSGTLLLSLNGSERMALSSGVTQWHFATHLKNAQIYSVSIAAQPSADVTCVISGGSGIVASGNVTSVRVLCPALQSLAIVAPSYQIAPGVQLPLRAQGTYSNSGTQDLTDQGVWQSADPAIATVSAGGLVTGVSPGNVAIQFTCAGHTQTVTLTVKNISLSSLALSPTHLDLAVGMSRAVKATGTYSDGSTQDLTSTVSWSSSVPAIAAIGAGTLTGVSAGSVTLTATSGSVSTSRDLNVTSATMTALDITPGYVRSAAGLDLNLRATASFSDGSSLDVSEAVTWASSSATVATVSATGALHLVAAGSATVTAGYEGLSAALPVTVLAKTISSLSVSGVFGSLPAGAQENLHLMATYSDSSTEDVTDLATWTGTDPTLAYVENESPRKGVVHGLAVGALSVTAALGSQKATYALSITGASLNSLRTSPGETLISKGIDLPFKAYGSFSDGQEYEVTDQVTWASSNTSYAEISNAAGSRGYMSNLYTGSSTVGFNVTATSGAVNASAAIILTPATLDSVVVNPSVITTDPYSQVSLRAFGQFSDGASTDLTDVVNWSSSASAVAVVSNADQAHGVMSALTEGTATLTARLAGLTGSRDVRVSSTDPVDIEEAGMGLKGEYFANKTLDISGYKGSRIDGEINYNWGTGMAPLGVGDSFSIRWTGSFLATTSEIYTFCTQSDDGVRLWVDGTQVINNWTDHSNTKNCGTIALNAGQKYSLQLEFYENGGYSVIELYMQSPTLSYQVVPRAQLFDQ